MQSLDDVPPEPLDQRVFRIAVKPATVREVADRDGLTSEQQRELAAFDTPIGVLDSPFQHSDHRRPTRFSDGTFPVFYSAEELETARQEFAHHFAKDATEKGRTPKTGHFGQWSCRAAGTAKNLVPLDWPELTAETYDACQALGRAAAQSSVDGLRSPSARHRPDGVCLPVFSRGALSDLGEEGSVSITIEDGRLSFAVVAR